MKQTILISLLSIASISAFAQNASCKHYAEMPKNATLAWPTEAYIATGNPECAPCYTYTTKHGLSVMECPGLLPVTKNTAAMATNAPATNVDPQSAGTMDVQSANSYTGNYPQAQAQACRRDPAMPKNAKVAWPVETPYVSTQGADCPPCYTYTSKHGLKVMECPFLYFMPEHSK